MRYRARSGIAVFLIIIITALSVCPLAPDHTSLATSADTVVSAESTSETPIVNSPETTEPPLIRGRFTHLQTTKYSDTDDIFYYSDDYFQRSANIYDKHLSTMSLNVAMAAMNSSVGGKDQYEEKPGNVLELFDKLGFVDFSTNPDFMEKPDTDTIGVAIAHKEISVGNDTYTLVPIAVRGGGYEREWISNMQIGSSGDAEGFASAADRTYDFLQEYMTCFNIDPERSKFWICGFSRGGAVTDLLTAKLTDTYNPSGERVYGYSFATPRAAYNPTKTYLNSHCVINPSDLVPYMAPEYLGFEHYGSEVYLSDNTEFSPAVLQVTYAVSLLGILNFPDGYKIETTDEVSMTQAECIDRLLSTLEGGVAEDRRALTETVIYDDTTIEDVLSALVNYLMTSDKKSRTKLIRELSEIKNDKSITELAGLSLDFEDVVKAVHKGYDDLEEEKKDEICTFLWNLFKPHLKKNLTTSQYKDIHKKWRTTVYVIMCMAHYDYVHSEVKGLVTIGSLVDNLTQILSAHSPEVYSEKLRKEDEYYSNNPSKLSEDTSTYTFYINDEYSCVNGTLTSSDPTDKVAKITAGVVTSTSDENVYSRHNPVLMNKTSSDTGYFYFAFTDTDSMNLWVDENKDYTLTLTATPPANDLVFDKWVDEEENEISTAQTLSIDISHGNSEIKIRYLIPRFKPAPAPTPTPTPPSPTATAEPVIEKSDSGLDILPIVMLITGLILLTGISYGIIRRIKSRSDA